MRNLKPRPAVAVTPALVSDLTCFHVVGLTGRQLRDLLKKHPAIPRRREGDRVLVAVADLVEWVRVAHAGEPSDEEAAATPAAPKANRVLALVGRERAT